MIEPKTGAWLAKVISHRLINQSYTFHLEDYPTLHQCTYTAEWSIMNLQYGEGSLFRWLKDITVYLSCPAAQTDVCWKPAIRSDEYYFLWIRTFTAPSNIVEIVEIVEIIQFHNFQKSALKMASWHRLFYNVVSGQAKMSHNIAKCVYIGKVIYWPQNIF